MLLVECEAVKPFTARKGCLVVHSRWFSVALVGLATSLAATACTSSSSTASSKTTSATTSATSTSPAATAPTTASSPTVAPSTPKPVHVGPAAAAVLTLSPATRATNVSPAAPIVVDVARGQLSTVSLINSTGRTVAGTLAADKTSWRPAETLGYGKKYTLSARAVNADGKAVEKKSTFTTLNPDRLAEPFFVNSSGAGLSDHATYGVGLVVNVYWDRPITDRRAAEKTLTVSTAPSVTGAWYWVDDQNVHWRPEKYYATGTKVMVAVNDYGRRLGAGLYGQLSKTLHFTIGASHVLIADDTTHHIKVYDNGKLVRDMPTSMGRGGVQVIKGTTITYWTPNGTYTVQGHFNPKLMDSTTFGLPLDQGGYKEYIYYATRISNGGIYLHQMASTVWAQGHQDVSHGCLNLSPANAKWFYSFSRLGDVVTVEHTGGATLAVWQGGDWSLPWSKWLTGGAV